VLGRLAETSGLLEAVAQNAGTNALPIPVRIAGFVVIAAVMAALMSNTASAAMLIPLALGLGLPPSIAVLIAIGTSFGVPFTISSPPNAMAYGEGGLSARDLLRIGLPLMIVGCLLVGLTGPWVLHAIGLP
jgi:sodium-dependent dicarboxylate transporter 2/3/5